MIWNTFGELKPAHGEDIIYLEIASNFGQSYFEYRETTVEYTLIEIDENGDETGTSTCYTDGDEVGSDERLAVTVNGYEPKDRWLWMYADDYQDFLEENIPY
jgi:hypothetical protein